MALEGQKFIPFVEKMIEKLEIGKNFEQVDFIAGIAYFLSYIAEYKKAESLYKRVLHISEKILGEEHPDSAIYKVLVRRLGINHPNTQIVYENMKE
ncbi:tetratricopeptide repeat protein [Lachnospiraceae bacterium 46-15]